jgi:AAA15 family ATPase/GTPase
MTHAASWGPACTAGSPDGRRDSLKKRKFSAIIGLMPGDAQPDARTMMLAFRASNARSFRDPLEFSLEATAMSEEGVPRDVPWRQGGTHPARVLPAAGVFGANASGKTNFLRIIDDMRRLVVTSFKSGDRSTQIYRYPFRLDPDYEAGPSTYEIDLIIEGVRYEYGFTVDSTNVISEYARRYPRGKAVAIFRRDHDDIHLGEEYRAKGRAVTEILRPNSLYLSAASAADHPGLRSLYEWFDSNLTLCEASSRESRWAYTTQLMARDDYRKKILAMLHVADLGITDAKIREPDPEMLERVRRIVKVLQKEMQIEGIPSPKADDLPFLGIALSHRGKRGNVELDSHDESLGTLVWLGLVGPVLDSLAHGTVLLADELEASLHPVLVAQLVRTFQNPHSNPYGAQLIFNSFEADLLGNSVEDRVIGRDQVWFTEKLHDGSTRLYPLTDLSPRKAEAVGRRYLAGRYGATPIISGAEFDALATMVTSEIAK